MRPVDEENRCSEKLIESCEHVHRDGTMSLSLRYRITLPAFRVYVSEKVSEIRVGFSRVQVPNAKYLV